MRKEKLRKKNTLTLIIFTSLTLVSWLGLDLYKNLQKTTVESKLQKQVIALNPNIDSKTVDNLKNRKIIPKEELDKVPEITQVSFTEESTETGSLIINEE